MTFYYTLNIDPPAVCQNKNSQFFGEEIAAKVEEYRRGNGIINYS